MITQELDINVHNFETDYFYLWFFFKNELAISTAKKHIGIIRIKRCKTKTKKME